MEKTKIGSTDIEVTRIALGTWAIGGAFWGGQENEDSKKTIRAAIEAGINFVDTAPVYGDGLAETMVGEVLTEMGARDSIVIATKVGLEIIDGKVYRNSTPERLRAEIELSFKRLKTDYIDLYQIHWPDPLVPIEQTAEVMAEFYRAGKIRAVGVSNYSPEQMKIFADVCPLHSDQPQYNLFEREIEQDVLPHCEAEGISVLAYSSLSRGLLSGKMTADKSFPKDDLRHYDPKFNNPFYPNYLKAVGELDNFAQGKYGRRVINLAVRWLLDYSPATIALWGMRRPEQAAPLADVEGWTLNKEDLAEIDRILAECIQEKAGRPFPGPLSRPE